MIETIYIKNDGDEGEESWVACDQDDGYLADSESLSSLVEIAREFAEANECDEIRIHL